MSTYITKNDENSILEVTILSDIGKREDQQDNVGYFLEDKGGIVTICDGMGGHEGGAIASGIATQIMVEGYINRDAQVAIHDLLPNLARQADASVAGLKTSDGRPMKSGSTMVTVVIENNDLHWVSAGDSRIYLKRDKAFQQITFDHIYKAVLDEKKATGAIRQDEYDREIRKGDMLISFLGVSNIQLLDVNNTPFKLISGDLIIMMTDGLYKIVSEDFVKRVLDMDLDIEEKAKILDDKAEVVASENGINRDNLTVAIIRVK